MYTPMLPATTLLMGALKPIAARDAPSQGGETLQGSSAPGEGGIAEPGPPHAGHRTTCCRAGKSSAWAVIVQSAIEFGVHKTLNWSSVVPGLTRTMHVVAPPIIARPTQTYDLQS